MPTSLQKTAPGQLAPPEIPPKTGNLLNFAPGQLLPIKSPPQGLTQEREMNFFLSSFSTVF